MSLVIRTSRRGRACISSQCRYYSAPVDAIPASKQRFIADRELSHFPKGFLLGSAHAGVKASNKTKDDVCIIASEKLCEAAAFFTRNSFRAAPVLCLKESLEVHKGSGIRGVVINSGCANAVTGTDGAVHAKAMSQKMDDLFAEETARDLQATKSASSLPQDPKISKTPRSLVMSTGVIGQKLPIDKILNVLPAIKESMSSGYDAWFSSAKAIMTTDTFPKLVTKQFTLPSHPDTTYTMAGISKGAGMIHPNFGTLLSVVCTDANVPKHTLLGMGKSAVMASYNSISIDGDTSTNDSVVLLANGAASPPGIQPIERANSSVEDYRAFNDVLRSVTKDLAQLVVRDGEGATKFITIQVDGKKSDSDLRKVARRIACSPLVKTAMYGRDANWGRILCAIGNSQVDVRTGNVTVSFGAGTYSQGEDGPEDKLMLVKCGQPVTVDEEAAKVILEKEDINIYVDLSDVGDGSSGKGLPDRKGSTTYWTCDFSHEYVTINGDYRT